MLLCYYTPFYGIIYVSVQIFIKDVKNFDGAFINGERLSPEGLENEPYELKSDDIAVCIHLLLT